MNRAKSTQPTTGMAALNRSLLGMSEKIQSMLDRIMMTIKTFTSTCMVAVFLYNFDNMVVLFVFQAFANWGASIWLMGRLIPSMTDPMKKAIPYIPTLL